MKIVVLTRPEQSVNAYGRFTGEILKAEGLNGFDIRQWQPGQEPDIADAAVVILSRCILQFPEIDRLKRYVEEGGHLIAFQPMLAMYHAFGAKPQNRVLVDAYVKPVGLYRVGRTVGGETIQFHGMASKVTFPTEFETRAWLYLTADQPTSYPAVAGARLGQGSVTFFTYDLPATVAAIRQGDPRLAYEPTAGFMSDVQCRPNDLFTGHLDIDRGHIPQADIHCNLLTDAVNRAAPLPLPRLWYYERPEIKSVMIMTSDDDWSTLEQFNALIDAVEENEGHILVFMVENTRISPEQVKEWIRRGHAFSVHTNPRSREIDPYWHMTESIRKHKADLEADYDAPARVYRSHCVHWQGYVESARILADMGFRMDSSIISLLDNWGLYVNGSGRPMRFVDLNGDIIDIFEQSVAFYDDASVMNVLKTEPDLEVARAALILRETVDRYHTPFGFLSHPVSFHTYSSYFVKKVLAYAHSIGVPILNADEWLEFTMRRDQARIEEVSWDGETLSFAVRADQPVALTPMVPLPEGKRVAAATVGGAEVEATAQMVHGRWYAMLPTPPAGDAPLDARVTVRFAADQA